ncbi:MAG: endonuclease domain-containing protein [Elusimicrobia bacterium]|nr:endonuclease domain-containing protein [Candidatus Liberimonas magnetica]
MKRNNIERSRHLRKNQTEGEMKLWSVLRNRSLEGAKFRRQFSVGRYILDFYSPEYKLAIEADGGQHYDEINKKRDERRGKELDQIGIRVLRFSNTDILNNIDGVCKVIIENIK